MKDEIIACIEDKDIKYLHSGQVSKYIFPMGRKKAHEKKTSHLIIRFFILTKNSDNEILYLVQKRGKNRSSYPEHFTDSASGHVNYKSKLNMASIKENALRELTEEFGIARKAVKNMNFYEMNVEKDNANTEIAYVFFGLVDNDAILKPDPKELDVKESKFYTKEELIKILANRKTVAYAKSTWNELLKSDINTLFKTDVKKSEQRNEIALFIGRFQPLHHGHVHVLKNILKFHDKIKIGIGSSQLSNTKNDPFTSKERRQFIDAVLKKRNITSKQYEIVDIPDIFDSQNWVKHVVSTVGEFKVIYSNSDWVRNLFLKNGFTLGRKLEIFKKKYNGTNVRKSISKDNKNWTKLVPKEVVNLMRDFKGIERIKHLYKSEEN